MADRLTVSYGGVDFEAIRGSGAEAGVGDDTPTWMVLRDGATITTFPARPDDTDRSVREKVLAWLEGNASRPAQDVNRQ